MKATLVGAVGSTKLTLEKLCAAGWEVQLATLPLSAASRHSDFVDLRPLCGLGVKELLETSNINDQDAMASIRRFSPDYIFVIGWSQILRSEFLSIPCKAFIGYHPALLPQFRGRGVIAWTILQRLKRTGATLFLIDEGMDSGDILGHLEMALALDETVSTLMEKHHNALGQLMDEVLPRLTEGSLVATAQDHSKATYCARRTADDGLIDWKMTAEEVWTLIRAVSRPYPGAFTDYRKKKLTIWSADLVGDAPYVGLPGQVQAILDDGVLVQCGDGNHVLIKTVQQGDDTERTATEVLKMHDRLGRGIEDAFIKGMRENGR
ncbi:MAG: methionyl-tRNA formyltransferase [Proteobacteria bacterium]|jgi:methionyl-tRNA formyltransferase|nr:methionyl-tRNA formyltransferase [Pseudomonadota bacterium]